MAMMGFGRRGIFLAASATRASTARLINNNQIFGQLYLLTY